MTAIFSAMVPLFLLIFLGFFLRKMGIAEKYWESSLSNFAIKVGLPALLFLSLAEIDFHFSDAFPLLIANSLLLFGIFFTVFAGAKFFSFSPKMFRTIFFAMAFGNVAFLGIPVLNRITEDSDILPTASLLVAVYFFWIFTFGVFAIEISITHEKKLEFFSRKKIMIREIITRIFLNPLLVAVFLGIIFAIFNLHLPSFLLDTLNILRSSVTPIVLITIGLFLAEVHFKNLSAWTFPIIFSVFKLVVFPIIFLIVLFIFGFPRDQFFSSLLDSAMPLAIMPFVLAEKYQFDKDFLARAILASTLFSALTLPAWIFVLS